MRMKIAIVDPSSYVLQYDFYYIREIAKSFDVDFYCSTTPFNWEYVEMLKEIPGIRVFSYRISAVPKLRGILNYMNLLTRLLCRKKNYCAIHFQFQILRGISAWIELFFFRAIREKFVFTMHNPVPHGFGKGKTYWIFRKIARIVRQLVFVSSYSRDRFVRDYNYKGKTAVLTLGIMPLTPNEELPEVPSSPAEKTIVFWGNIKPYKGIELLADMAESGLFEGIRFEVYGKWDSGMDSLKTRLSQCNVTVIDRFLDTDEVRKLLRRPAVFIFPYRHVTQSGVLYTLLFYGSVFVTSDSGDNARFARRHDLEQIIFNRNNIQSVRDAVDFTISNRQLIATKLDAIRSKYSWETVIPDPDAVYFGICTGENK